MYRYTLLQKWYPTDVINGTMPITDDATRNVIHAIQHTQSHEIIPMTEILNEEAAILKKIAKTGHLNTMTKRIYVIIDGCDEEYTHIQRLNELIKCVQIIIANFHSF